MSINRSKRYQQIRDEVWDMHCAPPSDVRDTEWWQDLAPKWRNRVGIPRLVADQASGEAADLLRSINPNLFRNDPDMLDLLRAAQEATQAFSNAMGRDSWRRRRPAAEITVVEVPRRWWQRRQLRLRCTCGWESAETWPARPYVELAYTDEITRRALAELHFGSQECVSR